MHQQERAGLSPLEAAGDDGLHQGLSPLIAAGEGFQVSDGITPTSGLSPRVQGRYFGVLFMVQVYPPCPGEGMPGK